VTTITRRGYPARFHVVHSWHMDILDIRVLRQELGLTRSELAGRLGVSPPTVKGWEAGDHIPIRRILTKIERLIEYREEDKALTLAR
jgi:transcriptional regulator with XRE-family HTH domain